jgi:hypothetical protein
VSRVATFAVLAASGAMLAGSPPGDTYSRFTDTASNAHDTVHVATGPRNTDAPAIIGTPRVGETVTADPGTWTDGTTFAYRWERCADATAAGCDAIAGAADRTYRVVDDDADKVIRVVVIATGTSGFSSTADAFVGPVLGETYYRAVGDELAAGTLRSWWRMNDTSGADVVPGGVGLNGSGSGWSGADCCGFGNPRGSLFFDGGGYMVAGDHYDFGGRAPFSVEFSVYTPTTGLSRRVVDKASSGGGTGRNGWGINLGCDCGEANNRVTFERWSDGSREGALGGDIPVNTWTHVVATYDGTTMRVYTNGDLTGSGAATLDMADTGLPLTLAAAAHDQGTGLYTGYLDEVQIYDQALPQSRVSAHYEAWLTG